MARKRILLTAFRGTSAELLIRDAESDSQCSVLYLPNDKEMDAALLTKALQQEHFDYVISLGQRPNIKDKVHIETRAGKGEEYLYTAFDCIGLKNAFGSIGLEAKLSNNAGTSFCNELYWNGLRYLGENGLDTKMVFMHVPFEKNISDKTNLRGKIFHGLEDFFNNDKTGEEILRWSIVTTS